MAILATLAPLLVAGCLPDIKPGFDSPAPNARIDAIVNASSLNDTESLIKLVEKLRSPAPAERMFAIRSLQIRTGQTLGYDHAAEHWQRISAYNRWLDWLTNQGITLPDTMTRQPEHPESSEGVDDKQPMESNTNQD